MKNNEIRHHIKAMSNLTFTLACELCKNDIDCIFEKLMEATFDDRSLGFWIWDITQNKEIYSPKFRKTLGFNDESDFPNLPSSWMNAITRESLQTVVNNFNHHITTHGYSQYYQSVTYNKKYFGQVTLICQGTIASWENKRPRIMIGMHLPQNGLLLSS